MPGLKPVTDPNLLAQLDGQAPAQAGQSTVTPIFSAPKEATPQTPEQTAATVANTDQSQAQAARIRQEMGYGNLPQGWRLRADGTAEPIPGGPADPNGPASTKLTPEIRQGLVKQSNNLDLLHTKIDNIQTLFDHDFKGFRLRELPSAIGVGSYTLDRALPASWKEKASTFDAAGAQLMGDLKSAMGMTGGEANSPAEVELRFGPYIPKASDSDETIQYKLKTLRQLLDTERNTVRQTLGLPLGGQQGGGNMPSAGQPINPNPPAPVDSSSQHGTDPGMQGDIGFNAPTDALPAGAIEFQHGLEDAIRSGQLKTAADIIAYGKQRNFDIDPAQAAAAEQAIAKNTMPSVMTPHYKVDISKERDGSSGLESFDAAGRAAGNSITAGIADHVAAGMRTIVDGGPYSANLAHEHAITDFDWQNHFWPAIAGTIAGAAAIPTGVEGAAKAAATEAIRAGAGREAAIVAARRAAAVRLGGEGAAQGTVAGVTTGEGDVGQRATHALGGAVTGAVTGAAMPYIAKAAGAASRATGSVLGDAQNLADRIVFKAIRADGNRTPDLVRASADAANNGIPYMVGDSGENARGVLSSSARAPGPGRTTAINALDERQRGLADRVVGHIERDLGPVANPHAIADNLMTQARTDAAPLYERAYARPNVTSFAERIAPLLQRPSMGRAMANARRIAAEEGRDPTELGFGLNDQGEVVLNRVPSWQTLDYVKRGMDDVIESYRDGTTGRLNLDTEGRAINNTQRQFLAAFDRANPDYAQARAAWGGPVSGVTAMNEGRRALKLTGDDLEARMRDMSPFERNMFALGARRAMAEAVDSKGDTANVVNTLVGTGKKRAMLARLFGNRQDFNRFVSSLETEGNGFRTFARARTGSPTAANHADDQDLAVAAGVADLATSGVPIITALRLAARGAAGRNAQAAQDHVARMLGTTDPQEVQAVIRRFKQAEARVGAARVRNRVGSTVSKGSAALVTGANDGQSEQP